MTLTLTLPWPPSLNRYWRHSGRDGIQRTHISDEGRRYRSKVALIARSRRRGPVLRGRVSVVILAYPPNRRRHDLDNLFKVLLDALGRGMVYEDDSQIQDLEIHLRALARPDGRLEVTIDGEEE